MEDDGVMEEDGVMEDETTSLWEHWKQKFIKYV